MSDYFGQYNAKQSPLGVSLTDFSVIIRKAMVDKERRSAFRACRCAMGSCASKLLTLKEKRITEGIT